MSMTFCKDYTGGQVMESFVLKGKAKTVFHLIELMAMGEKASQQQKPTGKKRRIFRFGK